MCSDVLGKTLTPEFFFQMAHLVSVKSHGSSMTGSQSLHDQSSQGVSAFQEGLSPHRPQMPRQNSDPTSETPAPPPRITSRDDRGSWLRQEEDVPPKVRIENKICCNSFFFFLFQLVNYRSFTTNETWL